jgi:hypothetical protein
MKAIKVLFIAYLYLKLVLALFAFALVCEFVFLATPFYYLFTGISLTWAYFDLWDKIFDPIFDQIQNQKTK